MLDMEGEDTFSATRATKIKYHNLDGYLFFHSLLILRSKSKNFTPCSYKEHKLPLHK